ncbi:hypothetical protein [Tsuneonella sp. SYSU-LHT278]|uniref:hypothetical protein n=1 Tax=Tsuneonella sediminis TaxID=3416089 RepID=UPI003F7ABF5C
MLVFAFTVWALHFAVSYGAALVFPGLAIARWITGGALVAGIAALTVALIRYRVEGGAIGVAAAGLAAAAMAFGTFPAIVG